jgi:hypothetical protein
VGRKQLFAEREATVLAARYSSETLKRSAGEHQPLESSVSAAAAGGLPGTGTFVPISPYGNRRPSLLGVPHPHAVGCERHF